MNGHDSLDSTQGGPRTDQAERPRDSLVFGPEWHRAILASIGDAVITTDTEQRITFLNSAAECLTGWTSAEAAGVPLERVFRVVSETHREPVESPTVRALRDGVVVGLANHALLIARDGAEHPIDDSAAPIHSDAGDIGGAVLVFRDVSERKRVERDVQAALGYADAIIATLREPFLVLDGGLRVQASNSAYYRSFHVTKEETLGNLLYDLGNHQWDIPRLRTLLEEVLARKQSFSDFEVEHTFPTLGRRVMLLNAHRVESRDSHPDLILLAMEDVSDRWGAVVALEASEIRYRRLFETAKDGILILDAESGKIADANPYMTELLGYPHAEFLGKELWQIGLFGDKAESKAAVRELQDHCYVRYDHLPLETASGEVVEVEFVSNVYSVAEGKVAQCNIRDIRGRRRLELQAQEQADELTDLHRRKDEFLAMLSHELRNPLAPIMNAVQLLHLQKESENLIQQQARTIIARQTEHLKRLVDDLLEVSRITTGRVRLRLERVAVRGILEGAIETARPLIDQRKHHISVSLPSEPIWLNADATRMEQVVVNLLTNAAKYMDQSGQIWLTAALEGDACVIRVRDAGIGIAPELLPRIFDLFTQAERLLDRAQGGLGIGLSLVQRLTELHGGTVEVFSTLGKGSEFVVRVPVAPLSAPESPEQTAQAGQPAKGRLRVLVVDDNLDMARSLAMLVKSAGHDVRTVHDGAQALSLSLDYRPNVVLLDIGLPGLHGYDVAKQLRRQVNGHRMVIVAVTGYGQESDHQRSRDEGCDHHLVKPPDFARLTRLLASISETMT